MQFTLSPACRPFRFLSGSRQVTRLGAVRPCLLPSTEDIFTLAYTDRLSNGRVLTYQISETQDGVSVKTKKLTRAEQAQKRATA